MMRPRHKYVEFDPIDFTRDDDKCVFLAKHLLVLLAHSQNNADNLLCAWASSASYPCHLHFSTTASVKQFAYGTCVSAAGFVRHRVTASLFAYDYEAMRLQILPLRRELLLLVMHPSRLGKLGLYDDNAPMP
jgi:hypothetical protein